MNGVYSDFTRRLPIPGQEIPMYRDTYERLPIHPIGIQQRQEEQLTQTKMKQIMDQMRFKQKMQVINKKKGKYKRSTNNCHKKYIGIIKNLVCLKLNSEIKDKMLERFFPFRNSRVYYFIMISYLKWYLPIKDIRWVLEHFILELSSKIERYRSEINITNNSNFIHFRRDEIGQMQFSIDAIYNFLKGNEQDAIRILYQKNKYIIIKKNEYLKTLQIIRQLRQQLVNLFPKTNMQQKQIQMKIQQVYQWNQHPCHTISQYPLNPLKQKIEDEKKSKSLSNDPEKSSFVKVEKKSSKSISQSEAQSSSENVSQASIQRQIIGSTVKQEQKMIDLQNIQHKYPLAGLENSYPVIDCMIWHNWLMQKHKTIEYQLKNKIERIPEQYNYQNGMYFQGKR